MSASEVKTSDVCATPTDVFIERLTVCASTSLSLVSALCSVVGSVPLTPELAA